jgi:hypothetical protein
MREMKKINIELNVYIGGENEKEEMKQDTIENYKKDTQNSQYKEKRKK